MLISYTKDMWTAFDLLKRFLNDLYRSIIFAAIEFDENLQTTKTTSQRMLIWGVIGIVLMFVAYGLLHVTWYFLDAIQVSPL